jgi:hypothetical protein
MPAFHFIFGVCFKLYPGHGLHQPSDLSENGRLCPVVCGRVKVVLHSAPHFEDLRLSWHFRLFLDGLWQCMSPPPTPEQCID